MDNLFREISHCGKFQVCHVTLVQMCRFVSAWAVSLMVFGLYNPGWRCRKGNSTSALDPKEDSTQSSLSNQMVTTINTSPQSYGNKLLIETVSSISSIKNHDIYNGTCDVSNFCNGIEFNPSSSTVVTEFNLICDRLWLGYVIITVLQAGMLIGSITWGHVGERYGRRTCLYCSTLIMAISSGAATFSPLWQVYAFFTFFIGMGVTGAVPGATVLTMEFLSSKWRARVTSVPIWNLGVMSIALVIFLFKDWRYVHLTTALVCLLACLGMFWTPESLRWLALHGNTSKAVKVVNKISKVNGLTIQPETFKEFLEEDNEEKDKHYSYLDLFKTRDIRILSIKVGIIRVISMVSYDILSFGIQSFPGDFYVNFIAASLVEVPLSLLAGPLANKIGRRSTGILFLSLGVLCCATIVISLLVFDDGNTRGLLVTGMALLNRSSIQAFIILSYVYMAELFPTAVRNLSFGYSNIFGRITGMFAPYLIPTDYISMIICFSVLMIAQTLQAGIIFTLTETKGLMLGDTINQISIKNKR